MNKESKIITQKQAAHKEAANLDGTDVNVKDILEKLFDDNNYIVKTDSVVRSVLGFSNGIPLNVLFSPKRNFFIARLIREFGIRKGLKKLVISSKIRIFIGENQ